MILSVFKYRLNKPTLNDGSIGFSDYTATIPLNHIVIRIGTNNNFVPPSNDLYVWAVVNTEDKPVKNTAVKFYTDIKVNDQMVTGLPTSEIKIGVLPTQEVDTKNIISANSNGGFINLVIAPGPTRSRRIIMAKTGSTFIVNDPKELRYLGFAPLHIGQELGLYVFEIQRPHLQ